MYYTHSAVSLSPRAFLGFYYKNRRLLLLAFWAPFILIIAASFLIAPRYKAAAVLTVRMGSEYVYQPETGSTQNAPQTTIPFDRDQIFKSEVAILSSDDLHRQVIKQIGLDKLYPDFLDDVTDDAGRKQALALALIKFDKRFDVTLEKESSVITVSFADPDADKAVAVLNTLLNLYMEKRKDLYLEPRVELAKNHAEDARRHAAAAEQALENFQKTHNILSFDAEKQQLIAQRSDVQEQMSRVMSPGLQAKLDYFQSRLEALNKDQAEYNALTNDASVANAEYAAFAHRLGDATAYEDLERAREGSVRVIQPPEAPAEPVDFQPYIIAAGFFLSLICAFAAGVIADSLTTTFSNPEDLAQALRLPVLVTLNRQA